MRQRVHDEERADQHTERRVQAPVRAGYLHQAAKPNRSPQCDRAEQDDAGDEGEGGPPSMSFFRKGPPH